MTAKELSTGVNQSIIINSTMKMSDEEIQSAIEDANEHAEADERKYRLAQLRNDADSAIYAAEKFIFDPEFRDQIPPSDIDRIERLIVELKEAVSMEDVVQITVKTKELNEATTEIGASFY